MDKFEKNIKDAVESFEAPYDAKAWQSLNKKLGPTKGTIISAIVGAAAVVTLITLSYNYMGVKTPEIVNQTNQNDVVKVNETDITNQQTNPNKTTTNTSNIAVTELTQTNNAQIVDPSDKNIVTNSDVTETTNNDVDTQTNTNIIDENNVDDVVIDQTIDHSDIPNGKLVEPKIWCDNQVKCLSEEFIFKSLTAVKKVVYVWDLGDGSTKTGNSIKHQYKTSGNYSVTLTLSDANSGRIINTSKSFDVSVLSEPITKFSVEDIQGVKPQTTFTNQTKRIVSTQWEITDIYATNLNEFYYSFRYKGDYEVKLTTTGENGCSSTSTKIITVNNDYNLLAPNAFSPNNDNLNDDFIPKALPYLDLPFTMTIYDRQGKMVYQTTDYNQPWDGLYTKDGIQAPSGLYVWVVQLTNEIGEVEIYQNQIMLTK